MKNNRVSKLCLILGLVMMFQDGDVMAGNKKSKRFAGVKKRFASVSSNTAVATTPVVQTVEATPATVDNSEMNKLSEENAKMSEELTSMQKKNAEMTDNLNSMQTKNTQMAEDLSSVSAKMDSLETSVLQQQVENKKLQIANAQNTKAITLQGNYSEAFNHVQSSCSGIGGNFNSVLKTLGFATVTSGLSSLAGAAVGTAGLMNRTSYKAEKTADLTQKIGTVASTASSLASTVSIASATKNMKSAIKKLKECRAAVSSFQKVVGEINVEVEDMGNQEDYNQELYDRLNNYVTIGNKVVSTCGKMSEKDASDIDKMMTASTTVSAVGTAASVAGTALEVASVFKEKKGGTLSNKQFKADTITHIGSSVASLGSTILNGVAQGKLKSLAQSAVDCDAILK